MAFTFAECNLANKTTKDFFITKNLPIEGKWIVMSFGENNSPAGYMHGSFRVEFNHNGTGSYFHYKDSLPKCNFNYLYYSDTTKLVLKYDKCRFSDGLLQGYKSFNSKMKKIRLMSDKFHALELFTQDNQKFILVRPVSYPKYWAE